MNEEWKDIVGYEGIYQISNMGNVRSLDRKMEDKNGVKYNLKGSIMKKSISKKGYERIELRKNNIRKQFAVHRLVASAFIPNPENKPEVNHIDENKVNNNVDNLEWCTTKENNNHGTRIARATASNNALPNGYNKKKVRCVTTGVEFNSTVEASKYAGLSHHSHITQCCRGTRKSAGKLNGKPLVWEYI